MLPRKIKYRDRPLKEGERYHHVCGDCGQEIPQDFVQSHECNPLVKDIY